VLLIEAVKDSEHGDRDEPTADPEQTADRTEKKSENDVENDVRDIQKPYA
jgi:hypothetical protein